MYLIDNNVLSHLTHAQRTSQFFSTHCRVPTEVLHEASGYTDAKEFADTEYPTTASVLDCMRRVMGAVLDGDTALVDLYANKGAADPILIACALEAADATQDQLFASTWFVVSNDKAVRTMCATLGVPALSRDDFVHRTLGEW